MAKDIATQKRPESEWSVFVFKQNLNDLYERPQESPWAYDEESMASEIFRRPDCRQELEQITAWKRGLEDKRFWPSMRKLLSEWTSALDRARTIGKCSFGPTQAEVRAIIDDKYPNEPRAANWAASFHSHWRSKGWKHKGRPIDWKVELSQQCAKWRTK